MSEIPGFRPITVAHDYFTQRGGAERVAVALIESLRPERVVCALYEPDKTYEISSESRVETSLLQRIRQFRRDPRRALLAFPLAWRLIRPVNEGVVLCSSSGWAHSIRVSGNARKVVYCHNPARWLYQPRDYFRDQPAVVRLLTAFTRPLLMQWDRAAARTASIYIANSRVVAQRVEEAYGIKATVVPPPVTIDAGGTQQALSNIETGYFLAVGRGRGYKHIDRLVEGFRRVPEERLVVVGEPQSGLDIPNNVHFECDLTDAELRWLYAHAVALVSVSHEDFGLTPLEANAMGTPALLLRAGGFLDSLEEGTSGCFLENNLPDTIAVAIREFPRTWDKQAIRAHATRFSLEAFVARLAELLDAPRDAPASSRASLFTHPNG